MATLASFLSEADKKRYVDSHLTPGQMLKLEIDFRQGPREKYALLLARDSKKALLFLVSSYIHPIIANNKNMASCQVELKPSEYGFLQRVSFLNCSQAWLLPWRKLRKQVLDETWRLIDRIIEDTRGEVLDAVGRSRTLSGYHARLILKSLRAECTRAYAP